MQQRKKTVDVCRFTSQQANVFQCRQHCRILSAPGWRPCDQFDPGFRHSKVATTESGACAEKKKTMRIKTEGTCWKPMTQGLRCISLLEDF